MSGPPSSETKNIQQAQVLSVVAQIINLVQQRSYFPGERILSERDVAERFGVGRAVVREAMAMLEAMRYLERRRGSGVFLSEDPASISLEALVISSKVGLPLSNKANQDSVEVRRIIEVQAIRLACERRTDESLARIRAILDSFEQVQDEIGASDYDWKFHLELVRSAGNDILTRLVLPFFLMSRGRRETYFVDAGRRQRSHEQHVEMLMAIEDRDVDRAVSLISQHIGRVDAWFHRDAGNSPDPKLSPAAAFTATVE